MITGNQEHGERDVCRIALYLRHGQMKKKYSSTLDCIIKWAKVKNEFITAKYLDINDQLIIVGDWKQSTQD